MTLIFLREVSIGNRASEMPPTETSILGVMLMAVPQETALIYGVVMNGAVKRTSDVYIFYA